MPRISAIGETVMDIIFKDGRPLVANPGGSVLNTMVSLARLGADTRFYTELGMDEPGRQVEQFLRGNGMDTCSICRYEDMQTPIALAYLDENNNARYTFYKNYPERRFKNILPDFPANGYFLFASSLAVHEQVRPMILQMAEQARHAGNIVYYDPNCRPKPGNDARRQTLLMVGNMRQSHIVRGSDEDFAYIFGHSRLDEIWAQIDSPLLQMLICTRGADGVSIMRSGEIFAYTVPQIDPISTVGAGDNFNAGLLYGLASHHIRPDELASLPASTIRRICNTASACASSVCCSLDNYISSELAQQITTYRSSPHY